MALASPPVPVGVPRSPLVHHIDNKRGPPTPTQDLTTAPDPTRTEAEKERAFVQAYVRNGSNALKAARASGLTVQEAAALLATRGTQSLIRQVTAMGMELADITAERVVQEVWRMASADIGDLYDQDGVAIPIHQLPPDIRKTIQRVKHTPFGPEYVLADKQKSLDAIIRVLGIEAPRKVHVNVDGSIAHTHTNVIQAMAKAVENMTPEELAELESMTVEGEFVAVDDDVPDEE